MNELDRILILSGLCPDELRAEINDAIIQAELDLQYASDKYTNISQVLDDNGCINLSKLASNPELLDMLELDVMITIVPSTNDEIDLAFDVTENAEFDIANNPAKPNGEVQDIDGYKITDNQANLKTRYVPARSGDNPLTGSEGISNVDGAKLKQFKDYIKDRNG